MYLTERGVRVTGTDAWSWDAPFSYTAERVAETGDTSLIWEGHKAGRDIGYCHLEKLHNLEALPASGFTVSCFPHKIRGAIGGLDPRRRDLRRMIDFDLPERVAIVTGATRRHRACDRAALLAQSGARLVAGQRKRRGTP